MIIQHRHNTITADKLLKLFEDNLMSKRNLYHNRVEVTSSGGGGKTRSKRKTKQTMQGQSQAHTIGEWQSCAGTSIPRQTMKDNPTRNIAANERGWKD